MKKVEIPYIRLASNGPFEEDSDDQDPSIEIEHYGRF
jgi:hypothetical protein